MSLHSFELDLELVDVEKLIGFDFANRFPGLLGLERRSKAAARRLNFVEAAGRAWLGVDSVMARGFKRERVAASPSLNHQLISLLTHSLLAAAIAAGGSHLVPHSSRDSK